MKKNDILLLALCFLFLIGLFNPLLVQAENNSQESPYLNEILLCKDVEEKEPVFETASFRPWDEKAVCWIRFTYQSPYPFLIHWEWISPDGSVYHTGEIEMEAGDYKTYRTWYWIKIEDRDAAMRLGNWKVKIYIEKNLLTIEEFRIE